MNKNIFIQYFRDSFGNLQNLPNDTPYYELVYSEDFRDDINVFINYFHQSKLFHISPNFYWDIVPSMDINAVCFKLNNYENIGLCYGLIALVYHYYGVLFCSDKFLPNLFSHKHKRDKQRAFFHQINDKELELHFNSMDLLRQQFIIQDHKIPIDSVRFQHMSEYGLYSCLFVFLHEIGHVVRGHLDQNTKKQEMISLSYNNQADFKHIEPIYLELDADKFSSYIYIKFFLENHHEFNLEPKVHFYHKWFPILLYFVLVDIRLANKLSLSHPKPAYRYALIKKHVLTFFYQKRTLFTILKKTIDQVEHTVHRFFKPYNIHGLSFFSDLNEKNDIKKLEDNYISISSTLNEQYKQRKLKT